jgi:tetratricopeptide (TPR) repeat protein
MVMIPDKTSKEISQIVKNASDLETKGKTKEAIAEYERAVKVSPSDGNLFNHLGDLYIKVNRIKEAVDAYMKGIDIFRSDNFYRNALGICKKVLRYDPGNLEINLIIAKLLVELDEKSDASIYLFSYIERQMALGKKKEVTQAIEYLKELKLADRRFSDKMAQIYEKVGEPSTVAEAKKEPVKPSPATTPTHEIHEVSIPPISPLLSDEKRETAEVPDFQPVLDELGRDERLLTGTAEKLDGTVKDMERVILELRKAMRLDEIISALDKSLTIFSNEQKKSIDLLQKSLSVNIETLQKSVVSHQQISEKSSHEQQQLIKNLEAALGNFNKNQTYLSQEISRNLEKVGVSFNTTADRSMQEIKSMMTHYEKATNDMVCSMNDTKECNVSLIRLSEDVKTGILTLNNTLIKFIAAQDVKEKKISRNIYIIIGLAGAIGILLMLSLIFK